MSLARLLPHPRILTIVGAAGIALLASDVALSQQPAGAPPLLSLPTDRPRPRAQSYHGDDVPLTIDAHAVARLRAFAAEHAATPFMVLLAALHAVLGRLASTQDVLVGASVANRTRAELEPLIGFFVNILVLRADLGAARTFDDLVAQVRERTLAAMDSSPTTKLPRSCISSSPARTCPPTARK